MGATILGDVCLISNDIFLSFILNDFDANKGSSSGILGSNTIGLLVGTSTIVGFNGRKSNPAAAQLNASPKIKCY